MGTILLSGIHGVGKTTAAAKLTERFSVPNFTASKIIKAAKSTSVSLDSKRVEDVDDNQRLLINGISHLLEINDEIILDGHFTLLNSTSKIEKIKLSVFEDLSLIGVILLLEQPTEIYNRLINRDTNALPLRLIKKYQLAEQKHAEQVTKTLNIPLSILTNYTDDELFTAFNGLISGSSQN